MPQIEQTETAVIRQFSIRMPEALWERLKYVAMKRRTDMSKEVNQAIEAHISKIEKALGIAA